MLRFVFGGLVVMATCGMSVKGSAATPSSDWLISIHTIKSDVELRVDELYGRNACSTPAFSAVKNELDSLWSYMNVTMDSSGIISHWSTPLDKAEIQNFYRMRVVPVFRQMEDAYRATTSCQQTGTGDFLHREYYRLQQAFHARLDSCMFGPRDGGGEG